MDQAGPEPAANAPLRDELQRTLGILLTTQQDLIDTRHQRDRERRVLDGIVRFSERASEAQGEAGFWQAVTEACVEAFECESCFVAEFDGEEPRLLARLGPGPKLPQDLMALAPFASQLGESDPLQIDPDRLLATPLGAKTFASLLLATLCKDGSGRCRLVAAGITTDKLAFFQPLDGSAAPAFRLFVTQAGTLFEMLQNRQKAALQLEQLDRSHQALQESEAKYRHLFEDSADGMALLLEHDDIIVDGNAALGRLLDRPVEDLLGARTPWRITIPADEAANPNRIATGEVVARSGLAIPIEIRTSRLRMDGRDYRLCVLHDISRRRRAEQEQRTLVEQLMQSRKMESIGRLAGGVAHDFNNLLTVICGYSELLQGSENLDVDQQQLLQEILGASRRAQSLTQQLLTFSRKQVIRPVPTELNEQIHASIRMYRRLISEDILLEFAPCAEPTMILCDPQQISQVLGNLLINARDAILASEPGRIRRILVQTHAVRDPVGAPGKGDYVQLSVADSGVGIDESLRQTIFEPFFTTKEVGRGTGLGLATVFGIVQQNHGAIDVTSTVGDGSTFTVLWPALDAPRAEQDAPVGSAKQTGSGVVLLVEDDRGVREFAAQALRQLGYSVTAAPGADEALAQIHEHGLCPDILVTDVVMPKTNGKELAERVRAAMPRLPVLFISGYTDDIIAQHGVLRDGVELLEKPFGIGQLAQRIRAMLDGRSAAKAQPPSTTS